MDQAARRGFCARGTALSFSVMRSPWERVLSSYLEKVAATQVESEAWSNKEGGLVGLILHDLGLRPGATISFSQFVLWLSAKEPGSDDNIHIMPWSVRCGAVPPARYSMIGRTETLEVPLPAAFSAQRGLAEERYAKLKDILKAKKKKVEDFAFEFPESTVEVVEMTPPPERKAGTMLTNGADDVPELLRLLQEEAKALSF